MDSALVADLLNEPIPAPPTGRAVVHDKYDLTRVPKHPGEGWTRFVCISDTHSHVFHVPPGDVLLHAGDLCRHGTLKDLEGTLNWLKGLPHLAKYFMAGNHDLCLDKQYEDGGSLSTFKPYGLRGKDVATARKLVHSYPCRKAGMHYLEHNTATYTAKSGKTYTIYGSPAAPFYSIGAFQYVAEDAEAIYARIPPSVDILMTHTPSHGVCDLTKRGKHAGCPKLAERLAHDDLKSCRLHLCGHIHEAHGVAVVGQSEQNPDGRIHVNAALPVTPLPIIIDLKD
ncbi:Metallo-dependent phosphatase [Trametes versicolor FP-101664 SS1]|uniref:Metallo-dependent phosphatase n=1 Tax=Trametes versicolor (strain FP-101664) TaxID=717944 RepID=UPI00046228F0|nr:Metallo-dependent phosphatase [Trametes versicolor FP-101664 SS1]EIW60425.1 Metallo-dependent phosphatase [Trametes versicolor FP-101664 SS1]